MNMMQVMSMLPQLRSNPLGFLAQRGINVPQNLSNDPNSIIQYLMSNGMVSQEQYNQARQMVHQFGMK